MSTTGLVDRLLPLWFEPVEQLIDPVAAFRAVYTDPVTVNSTPMPVATLVDRARAMQVAFPVRRAEVLEQVETADKVVLGFVLHARHSGLLRTSLGDVQATGREVAVRTVDVLTVRDGKVAEIVVVSDEAGLLQQLGVAVAPRPEG